MKRILLSLFLLFFLVGIANAGFIETGRAAAGVNSDITSMTGLSNGGIPGLKVDLAIPGAIGGTTPAAGAFTRIKLARTAVGAADYNPSILTSDYIIAMTDTAAARAVIISTEDIATGSATSPRLFVIKDESGNAAANNITISLETAGNIDGAATYVINQNYQSIDLYINGTNGFVF